MDHNAGNNQIGVGVEELAKQLEAEKKKGAECAAAYREQMDDLLSMLDNERRRGEERAKDDQQRIDLVSAELGGERKRAQAREKDLHGENAQLKEEVAELKRRLEENDVVKNTPKEEPTDIPQPLLQDYQGCQIPASEIMRDEKLFKKEEMNNENQGTPKEELFDIHQTISKASQIKPSDLMVDMILLKKLASVMAEDRVRTDARMDPLNDSSLVNMDGMGQPEGTSDKLRRSSRNVVRIRQHAPVNSAMNDEPSMKRARLESEKKKNENPLQAVTQKKRSSVSGASKSKSGVEKTPQCILCEAYPTTAIGYVMHLNRNHNATLRTNGVLLKCACNFEVTSRSHCCLSKHDKKCDGRQFSLQKLNED